MNRYVMQSCLPSLLILLMTGQAQSVWGTDGSVTSGRGDRARIHQQFRKPLTVMFTEEQGYGMYTYVLFGHPQRPAGGVEKATVERYDRLLEAINHMASGIGDDGIDQKTSHLFLIPLKSAVEDPTQHGYNTELSMQYLSFTSGMLEASAPLLSRRLTTAEGPFLITVPQPLKDAKKQGTIVLYADLTFTDPSRMDEIVKAYRGVLDKGIHTLSAFGALRSALMTVIPDSDNHLKIVVATRGDPEGVARHLWKPLTTMHAEERGFGMYTYVLFGRRLKPLGRLKPETLARYEKLLQAIHLSTLSVTEVDTYNKAETNILLIPLTVEAKEPNRNNYNIVVSLRYLSIFSSKIRAAASKVSERLARLEGPFLISTLQPFEDLESKPMVMLYADLSNTNPAAMEEIVAAYKKRVEKGVRQIERFRSLRLALLDLILDAEDNIKIVQTAVAGE